MKLIPVASIIIAENRQRRTFALQALNELGESIKRHGLFTPILLREEPHDGVDGWVLVAGERRLRAIKDLWELGDTFSYDGELIPVGQVPFVTLGELDEVAREEAELEENIRREDLPWLEKAEAVRRLAALRAKQAAAAGKPAPTTADLSEELRGHRGGRGHETVRQQIALAEHKDEPEVKNAKSLDEAWKLLKRKEEAKQREQLAAEVGRTYSAETAHQLLNEDCLNWMLGQAGEQFDVILTDPPYGIGADEFGDSGGHTGAGGVAAGHQYEDDYDSWLRIIKVFAESSHRLAKPQAHLYCFCAIQHFEELKAILTAAGWKVFTTPIIWHKPNGNRIPWIDSGPQRKYELILYAKKGDKPVTRIYPDLVTYSADENLGHEAQKPVALYTDLLRRSVNAGDRILDPFAGSCPVLVAASELKCRATAIEVKPAAYAIGVRRLQALSSEPELEGLDGTGP